MAKKQPNDECPDIPKVFPEVAPPRDLYATTDIRFVMVEIGKLTSSVDRLIVDVRSQSDKVDALRHQISFVKGGLWALVGAFTMGVGLLTKWDAMIATLKAALK